MIESRRSEGSAISGVVSFPAGLPGFPDHRRFRIEQCGAAHDRFRVMRAVDDPDVSFLLVSPWVIDPNFEVVVDDDTASRLDVHARDEVAVYCIVTERDRPEDATVNLFGPIVVNCRTRQAAQVALPAARHRVHTPLGIVL